MGKSITNILKTKYSKSTVNKTILRQRQTSTKQFNSFEEQFQAHNDADKIVIGEPVESNPKHIVQGLMNPNAYVMQPHQEEPKDKTDQKKFIVFRSNPSSGVKGHQMGQWINLKECGPMILDVVIKIKDEIDPTLSFRRSCREGICGSCAMNINDKNTLACLKRIDETVEEEYIQPLPKSYVIRDLAIDMTHFYNQQRTIKPYLQKKPKPKEVEYATRVPPKSDDPEVMEKLGNVLEQHQTMEDRELLDGLQECVLCASCQTTCPIQWWHSDDYLGPAVLMQAWRWVADSRDDYTAERLHELMNDHKVRACHGIGACTKTCPKGLDPKEAIIKLKARLGTQGAEMGSTSTHGETYSEF